MKKNEVRFELVSAIISLRLLKKSTKIPIAFYGELQEASRAIQLDAKKGIMKDCLKRMNHWEDLFKGTTAGKAVPLREGVNQYADKHITPTTSEDSPKGTEPTPTPSWYPLAVEEITTVLDYPVKLIPPKDRGTLTVVRDLLQEGDAIKQTALDLTFNIVQKAFRDYKTLTALRTISKELDSTSEEHLLNRLTAVANIETDPAKAYLAKLLLEDLLTNKANFALADTVYRNAFKVTKEID